MTGIAQTTAVMDGVLNVKKEAGWTSHDVVAKIRSLLGGGKVGHAGTLDPAATGVLPVLMGRGTRIAEYLVEWDKEYRAVLRLGEATDTQDATGTIVSRQVTGHVTTPLIEETLGQFLGSIEQVPPMYSAVKVAGVPLYKSARAGKTIAREPRPVTVHRLDLLAIHGCDVTLRVVCSKGTYVRTLCADIGRALGVGGHLLKLERSRVGPLTIEQAITVDEVTRLHAIGRLPNEMLSLDRALQEFPAFVVDAETAVGVTHGMPISSSKVIRWESVAERELRPDLVVRVHDGEGRLLAIAKSPRPSEASYAIEKVLIGPT